jgi:methyltransferase-like protein/trans-aconitate methyltransferase
MTAPANEISYDELPYTNYSFAQTHPDRIAALATLFGVEPPPVASCRVLELGCAAAGNLVPMAVTMPDAQFVGIDLSARQIADGQAIVDALPLRNVQLRALSITDIEESLGAFDYIVAHGVFSWVPRDVQERLLEICSRYLAPKGIAFVSYNTLPGWHARGVIRELMRYHVEQFADGRTKVREARAIGEFLAANLSSDAGYSAAVTAQIEALRGDDDAYIAHEHLEGCNDPIYFHQFVERAAAHRLQYLAESDFGTMLVSNLRAEIAQRLAELTPDTIRREQYMDFLRNRSFRQTLLVHDSVAIDRSMSLQRLRTLGITGLFEPQGSAADLRSSGVATFRASNERQLQTANAITRAAVVAISDSWPCAVRFDDLMQRALATLRAHDVPIAASEAETEATLASDLLRCFSAGLIQLWTRPSPYVAAAGPLPRASPLARWQATRDLTVTNLRHEPVKLNADVARLIQLLDGTRKLDDIVHVGTQWAIANAAVTGIAIPSNPERFVRGVVEQTLAQLGRAALLQA